MRSIWKSAEPVEKLRAQGLGVSKSERWRWGSLWGPPAAANQSIGVNSPSGLVFAAYVPALGRQQGVKIDLDETVIQISGGGELVRMMNGEKRPVKQLPKKLKRGRCRGMSRASRLRQLMFVNSIDQRKILAHLFLTLTLRGGEHLGIVESWELIESARRKWFKRLARFLQGRKWFAMWRKEPHENGLAHLHVLIFFLDSVPHLVREFRPWNDAAWAASVGDESIKNTACRSELLRKWNGVKSYLCKYLAKEQDLQDVETGKVWDVVGRLNVPVDMRCEVVKRSVGQLFLRTCRKWHQRKIERWEVKLPDDEGQLRWLTIRPWMLKSGRVVSVSDQIKTNLQLGHRIRRRRPKLSYTPRNDDGSIKAVPVWEETWRERGGKQIDKRMEKTGEEFHTYFSGTYFLPDNDSTRLVEWAKCEHVRRLCDGADLPF